MNYPWKPNERVGKRSCLGRLGRLFFCCVLLPAVLLGIGLVFAQFYPPFGERPLAKVLLVGLDEPTRGVGGGQRRSDTIILCAVKLNGSGATLLSIPRDARVQLPNHQSYAKINAAYSEGRIALLQQTLAQPQVLHDVFPYYLVLDSQTTRAVVDAIGGVQLDVPVKMDYDDNWGNLHIHLAPGRQRLNGEQVVGYLRWRKNNHGKGHSDDIQRTARQRALLVALAAQAHTWDGLWRLPAAFAAFQRHSWTNLTLPQLVVLAWSLQHVQTAVVPGVPRMIDKISYVLCDWPRARQLWQKAIQ